MAKINILDDLKGNTYPGRGIVIGKHKDNKNAVIAYFIMGRSVNSRNRIFEMDGCDMKTKAFDESKLSDPSLIIYYPLRVLGKTTVITNGDQTDTIRDYLVKGDSFENALRTRTFEPDPDNYTPRISGVVDVDDGECMYKLSILKSAEGNPASAERFFFEYNTPIAGIGHFIHTYKCDGDPIPSFVGEPKTVEIDGDIDTFTAELWNSLNEDNKVSLYVRYIDMTTGEAEDRIVNKNK